MDRIVMWSSLVLLCLAGSLITAAIPLDNIRVGALPNPKYTPGFMHHCFSERLCYFTHAIFLDDAVLLVARNSIQFFSLHFFRQALHTAGHLL
jgi:hypothetical protein